MLPSIPIVLVSASLGVISHLTYFIRANRLFYHSTFIFLSFLLTPIVSLLFLTQIAHHPFHEALALITVAWWSFTGAIWLSMAVYRAFFHRLGTYPGPFMARLSQLWRAGKNLREESYKVMDGLHSKYGEYVRVGPSEISITDPEAIELILGAKSTCGKSLLYDVNLPMTSLQQTRDKAMHAQRRRDGWDKAFSTSSLRNYESRVVHYTDELIRQLSTYAGKPINICQWLYYFAFDVMGDLSFGKPFDMLRTGEAHAVVKLLQGGMSWMTPAPWIIPILLNTVGAGRMSTFITWSEEQVEKRKKMKPAEPDIMSYLLGSRSTRFKTAAEEQNWLVGDSRLIVVAGSDTTSTALAFACYYLARDPSQAKKLRAELHGVRYEENPAHLSILQNLNHLNGVINETLRLNPPVPSGVYRLSPPQGLRIGDHFIPGDINILTPTWTIQRSPKSYIQPLDFIPERWYSKPELIKNNSAFIPFALGHWGCIGKQLAYMEMRAVITRLVMAFDITFAPGEDGRKLLEESKDAFTMIVGDMYLLLKPRD